MRWIAWTALVALLAACGGSADVRFVVASEGAARATDVELQVGDETRFFESVENGREIVERAVPEGTHVGLRATNGGDDGTLTIEAWQDDCARGVQRCEGEGCTTFVEFTVRAACRN